MGRRQQRLGYFLTQRGQDGLAQRGQQAATHPIVTATGATAMCSAIQDDVTALARAGSSGRGSRGAAGLDRPQQQGDGWSSAVCGQRST